MSGEIEKFIDREWISRSETDIIIKETVESILRRKRNTPHIDLNEVLHNKSAFLHRFLNEVINYAVSFQLLNFFSEADLIRLRNIASNLEKYSELIDKLKRIGFPLEQIPPALRRDAKQLIDVLGKRDASKRYKGQAPWESVFYPEVLALYSIVFEENPKSTANPTYNDTPGSTVVFLHLILEYVHDAQTCLEYEGHFKDLSSNKVRWKIPTHHDLRNKIDKWKKHPRNATEEEKAWRRNARFYEQFV